ncbi:MAG: TonB-dependent receptor [Chitinophagaceae bacterium]|nr:TonB-dependent receptor [Chitinophagaceae bacterium]
MWKVGFLFLLLVFTFSFSVNGQYDTTAFLVNQDTLQVTITAFGQYRREQQVLPSQHILVGATLDRYNKTSFIQSLNTLPGVRMEERSPGSYRLNMRGSSLRSPFGVRNVKVYYNGLPLTDAGGNTYFNQLSFNNISSVEISKGPAGSMYGAGTGGLVLLNSLKQRQAGIDLEAIAGSFGLVSVLGTAKIIKDDKMQSIAGSFTTQDGYRNHTRMHRGNISYSGEWVKRKGYSLTGHILATDMYYQTPGGLTQAEFDENPRQSRPRVGSQPSAEEAKAAIFQQNLLAGIQNTWMLGRGWENETSLFGSYASIKNPAIRNYEQRSEPGWGLRSVFTNQHKGKNYLQQWISGAEAQWGHFHTTVYTNVQGEKGNKLTDDDLKFFTWNAFTQLSRQYGDRWEWSAGVSFFQNHVQIGRMFPQGAGGLKKDFTNDWAPRLSVLFRPKPQVQLSALVSRGFSPPTVGELLPSTGILNTALQPEYGWNYEAGIRLQTTNGRWSTGINLFRFDLQQTIVQRRDSTGADYFDNAGRTKQQGIEWTGNYLLTRPQSGLQVFSLKASYTYSHFRYEDFKQLNNDFSGNSLPSVPAHTWSVIADAKWKQGFFVQATFYAASAIWLNDANTARADAYQLVGIKAGYGKKIQVYAGVENLLDQTYSLGNDINAFGGRYFNVAAARNFYGGVSFKIR